MTVPLTPSQAKSVKACCATAYDSNLLAFLLGDTYHPGGRALTRTLAQALDLRPGQRVLDVASGPGTSARLLAGEYGVCVDGIDLASAAVQRARVSAEEVGLSDRVRFRMGDAERIPFDDGTFDAVVCECAFCTFPDKPAAAAEIARVLRPGGRVGITDVTVDPGRLPTELTSIAGWVACLAGARPLPAYAERLCAAGLRVVHTERHDGAIVAMVDQIETRLLVLRLLGNGPPIVPLLDVDDALRVVRLAAASTADGAIGYALLVAEKPTASATESGIANRS